MTNPCMMARKRMAKFVGDLRGSTTPEKIATAVKAMWLLGIVTPAKGVAGNIAWQGARTLMQPGTAAFDYIEAVGRSIADNKFTVTPNEYRTVVNNLNTAGLQQYGKGFGKGAGIVKTAFRSGVERSKLLPEGSSWAQRMAALTDEMSLHLSDKTAAQLLEHAPVRFDSPLLQAAVNTAFLLPEIADRPFFGAATQASMAMQSRLLALREGLSGGALTKRAAEILRDRESRAEYPEMEFRALQDAKYATFKDKVALAKGAEGLKNALKKLAEFEPENDTRAAQEAAKVARAVGTAMHMGGEGVLPFVGVPSSMVSKMGAMSPLGGLSSRIWRGPQYARAEQLMQTLVGTGGVALGMHLWDHGLITGARPTGNAGNDFDAAGMQEYSLKTPLGWLDLRTLGPAVSSLFIGVGLRQAREKNPDMSIPGTAAQVAATTGKFAMGQSYVQSVKQISDAVTDDSGNKGEKFAASLVPWPAMFGQIARAIDDQPREARTFGDKLLAKTPGLSMALPPKLTSTGVMPTRTMAERIGAPLSPLRIGGKSGDQPELEELRRLKVVLGMPGRTMKIDGKTQNIPDDVYRQLVIDRGGEAIAKVRAIMDDPEYKNDPGFLTTMRKRDPNYAPISDEERANWLRKELLSIKSQARQPVRETLTAGGR